MQKRLLTILFALSGLTLLLTLLGLLGQAQRRPGAASLPTLAQLPTLTAFRVSTETPAPPTPALPAKAASQPLRTSAFPAARAVTATSAKPVFQPTDTRSPPSRTVAPSPTITETASPVILPPLEIDLDSIYSLSLEFRQPVKTVLEDYRHLLPDSRLMVSAYRDTAGWAKITLVPTSLVEARWAISSAVSPVELVAREISPREWKVFLVGSQAFETIRAQVPPAFIDYSSPLPPLEGEYRFPWQNGQSWWAVQGWHDGNGLDFQPGIGARFGVYAAQAGRLRELCSDGYQSLVEMQHADGRSTYYLHLRLALSTRRQLLDQAIRRGQYLGELIEQQYFVTACGQGNSRHLHFVASDRTMSIEGYPLEEIAASASCCVNPPSYRSSNTRVNTGSASMLSPAAFGTS